MSIVKTVESHLLADSAITAVTTRVYGHQIPDSTALPYVLIERDSESTQRFSIGRLVRTEVTVTSYAETAEAAEALGGLVGTRMLTQLTGTIDARPTDESTAALPERGTAGKFRYGVPSSYTITTSSN